MKIALLGAESTGKTQLALDLASHVAQLGKTVAVVPEVLREWCGRKQRTPQPEEQMSIAQEQERRADEAAAVAEVAICDTTSLMVAIYSGMLFNDGSLYPFALENQRGYDLTLLTGLDLPWVADGLQRDGPHVREPVDALVRAALDQGGIPYRVIYGDGPARLANALAAIEAQRPARRRAWKWMCDKCSDPYCEHRLFSGAQVSRLTTGRENSAG